MKRIHPIIIRRANGGQFGNYVSRLGFSGWLYVSGHYNLSYFEQARLAAGSGI